MFNWIIELILKAIAPDVLAAAAAVFTALAPALLTIRRNAEGKVIWSTSSPHAKDDAVESHGSKMLLGFAVVLIIFATIATVHYWDSIKQREDLVFSIIGLWLTMMGGMFVQVLAANYKSGFPLFQVTASQLAFPLLFSPIVFYPVWALTTGGSQHLFAFYAAFLDGYFWESIVSSAQAPNQQPSNRKLPGSRSNRKRNQTPATSPSPIA